MKPLIETKDFIKIRSFDPPLTSLLKNLTKTHTNDKSGDFSIMNDNSGMSRL